MMGRFDFSIWHHLRLCQHNLAHLFLTPKNLCNPLISLMFFTLAQPCTGKYAYDHNVRTHITRKKHYSQGSVSACSTGARLCQRFLFPTDSVWIDFEL
jgi:hypothetical protein